MKYNVAKSTGGSWLPIVLLTKVSNRTLKTAYPKEIIILVNRVRHPRVQGKTCTRRGVLLWRNRSTSGEEKSSSQSEKRYTLVSRHLSDQVENWLSNKSIGWMPRHWEPKKDVISCEKLRGLANTIWSADIWMGKPTGVDLRYRTANT